MCCAPKSAAGVPGGTPLERPLGLRRSRPSERFDWMSSVQKSMIRSFFGLHGVEAFREEIQSKPSFLSLSRAPTLLADAGFSASPATEAPTSREKLRVRSRPLQPS